MVPESAESLPADVKRDMTTTATDLGALRLRLGEWLGTQVGATVTVGAEKGSGRLSIWVEDQGLGIKPEELGRIFEPFFKASTRPTAGEASHGLGLAIVKRMVELHNGTVSVESAVGKGSRFTVSLPLAGSAIKA